MEGSKPGYFRMLKLRDATHLFPCKGILGAWHVLQTVIDSWLQYVTAVGLERKGQRHWPRHTVKKGKNPKQQQQSMEYNNKPQQH